MTDGSNFLNIIPEELLERMKENLKKDYKNYQVHRERSKDKITVFKTFIMRLNGSPQKVELQVEILEDIILELLTPYSRQLLLESINKKIEERENLAKKAIIEDRTS